MTRLLIVRLGSMGDIVHALPAVASLRAAFPAAQIDWVVESRWKELLAGNPDISQVIPIDTQRWRRELAQQQTWSEVSGAVGGLRQARYDAAVDFQGLLKSALVARLSGAPRRIGFEKGAVKEAAAALFYTERVPAPENAHVVEMNLALARAAGATADAVRFPLPARPEDEAYIEEQLGKQQLREFFILSPGGGWGSKCWPVERYAQVHNALAQQRGWRSFLNAGPGEERLLSEFTAQARVTRPAHFPLTLGQLVALVRRARVLIAGDTGPLHVAAAVGTPVVGLFGPTDPTRNGPYPPRRAAVIHHREQATITYKHEDTPSPAMLAITVDEVLAAVEQAVEGGRG